MNLDELQRRWDAHDRRLATGLRLNAAVARTLMTDRVTSALRPLARWLAIELAAGVPVAVWLGTFLVRHLRDARYAVPAALLLAGLVALLAFGVRQLAAIRAIDWTAPVLALQTRLESLRIERLRTARAVLVLGPLLWVPALLVVARGALGVDLYAAVDRAWLVANVLLGAAVVGIAWWVSRRYADGLGRSPFARRLARDLVGASIHDALVALAALRAMEEPSAAAATTSDAFDSGRSNRIDHDDH